VPKVLAIILGGGKGTRLFPLTKERAKPAVPFGGKYRLVDIPISNCINSNFKQVYILTQFNSASLHMHITHTYQFDSFSHGFVEILAAEQTFGHSGWYEGTADAVRKNFPHFRTQNPTHYIILSGDQLYRMDLDDMFNKHVESQADISIACTPVAREDATELGILKADKDRIISSFIEKPSITTDIEDYRIPQDMYASERKGGKDFFANMGIYIFSAAAMEKALDNELPDFGKEIIPESIKSMRVSAYPFFGYWEDIGTIKNFYEANIDLSSINPQFNFYDETRPIFTHKRNLPASKINYSTINQTLTADGCIITNASISNSVVGIRTIIESGANLHGVVCMGADYYESEGQKAENQKRKVPDIGIGKGCIIKGSIIDKNARIGENCRIGIDDMPRKDGEFGNYHVIDGVIVIPKNAVILPGTVI
jgi:glucose-1-phosphate adenylyltransferase